MIKYNSLKNFNTFRLDIYAEYIYIIYSISDLKKVLLFIKNKKKIFILLGKGSNILLMKNFYGIIIINRLKGIKIKQNLNFWFLNVYSGEIWSKLVDFSINNGIFGLENLCNIPGTIGSAVVNNIGAYGLEIKKFVYYIKVFDVLNNIFFYIKNNDCHFSYRYSIFKKFLYNRYIIIKIGLKINKKWKPCLLYKNLFNYFYNYNNKITPINIYNKILDLRNKKIPNYNKFGNVGSIFKNPIISNYFFNKLKNKYLNKFNNINSNNYRIPAALLIDICKLKGYTIGGAEIYNKQPLIIINNGYATSKDIFLLFNFIRKNVFIKFNILLELEIKIIDFNILNKYNYLFKINYFNIK